MGLPVKKEDHTYTYAEYSTWPDEERWELIRGTAWDMSPAPGTNHQKITGYLFNYFYEYLQVKPCEVFIAPFDVLLPDHSGQEEKDVPNVVQPDITVICNPEKITPRGCYGAPDLVVEVISPYTMRKDLVNKFSLYEEHGVKEYWVVDPGNRYIHLYALKDDGKYAEPKIYVYDNIARSTLFKDIAVSLEELFRNLTPMG